MPIDQQGAWESTPLGKVLRTLGTGERLGTQFLLRPAAESLFPEAQQRLQALKGDVYAGDVLEAISPSEPYPSPWKKLGRGLLAAGIGGAVDPLSYLQFGALTQAGRKAAGAGRLAEEASQQARMGQRALVSAGIPFGKSALPLVKGAGVFKAAEAIQSGHALERVAQAAAHRASVLQRVGVPEMAKFLDGLGTSLGQKFGVNIGADAWLMRTHQDLFSAITGGNKIRADEVIDTLEPAIHETARRFSAQLGIPEQEALIRTRDAVVEALDAHPYIQYSRGAKTFSLGTPAVSDYDKARRAIVNNFGLPATFGGPASPTDTAFIRSIRAIAVERKRMLSNIRIQDETRLGKKLSLVTHPDANYGPRIESAETQDWIRNYKLSALQGNLLQGRGYTTPPSSHIMHELRRTARVVDPLVLQEFKDAGLLQPFTVNVVSRGKKVVRTIDPEKWLQRDALRPTSKRTLKLVSKMVDAKILSLDESATNYIGKLIPSIPVMDFNNWVWTHGWGIIPPQTIKNFSEVDPTIMDVQRGMVADRAMLSKEWFDSVKTRGATDPSVPRLVVHESEPVIPAGWVKTNIPELEGYYLRPDEANFMRRYYEADINLGPSLKKAMHVLHQANQGFKGWALSIFPAYHTRNFVGSLWNYSLGYDNAFEGAANLKRSVSSWKAIRSGKIPASTWKLEGTINAATGSPWTATEIWKEVQARNGWGVGFISNEPQSIKRAVAYTRKWGADDPERQLIRMAKDQWKAAGRKGSPFIGPPDPGMAAKIKEGLIGQHPYIETGFRIGSYVDDRIRMAHVIQKLREGLPIDDAVRSMKKYFFDYHQLAPFEKAWAKEAIPFYAWSRKNIPLQLEALVRRPDRIARLNSALQGWEATGHKPQEEKYINAWMLKNFPVRIRKNAKGKWEYFIFKNWLPLADIQDIFHITDWATQGLTPWARVPMELIANTNFFTDRKIDYMNDLLHGERTRYGTMWGKAKGVGVPNKVAHVINSFRLTNTLHGLLDNPQDLDIASQFLKNLAGRTYPLDVGRSSYQLTKELEELGTAMKRSVRAATFAHDRTAVLRLTQEYIRQRNAVLKSRGLIHAK